MSWKIEKWLEEVVPLQKGALFDHIQVARLESDMETVVRSVAVLDVALAQLISMKLVQDQKVVESFLGLDGSARAPLGTFGARIDLCFLLGIIDKGDRDLLRLFKGFRNKFAHRVNMSLSSPEVVKEIGGLLVEISEQLNPGRPIEKVERKRLRASVSDSASCRIVFAMCYFLLHEQLKAVAQTLKPISAASRKETTGAS